MDIDLLSDIDKASVGVTLEYFTYLPPHLMTLVSR
jgi:hypothetical protein